MRYKEVSSSGSISLPIFSIMVKVPKIVIMNYDRLLINCTAIIFNYGSSKWSHDPFLPPLNYNSIFQLQID